jgi:hypothetical protein
MLHLEGRTSSCQGFAHAAMHAPRLPCASTLAPNNALHNIPCQRSVRPWRLRRRRRRGYCSSGVAIGTSLSGFLAAFCNIKVTAKERVVDSRCIPLLPLPPRRFLTKSGQIEVQIEQQCVFHPISSVPYSGDERTRHDCVNSTFSFLSCSHRPSSCPTRHGGAKHIYFTLTS